MELTLRLESMGRETVIRLFSERAGDETARFVCAVSCEDGEYQSEIPGADMQELLDVLKEARVPVVGNCPFGLDGTSYRLTIINGFAQATFSWWQTAEQEWASLGVIAGVVLRFGVKCSGQHLP